MSSIIIGLSFALLLASCASAPSSAPPRFEAAAVLDRASRADYRGIPLVTLRGTAYEVGYQYGRLLAPELGRVQGEFSSVLGAVLGTGPKRALADRYLLGQARKTLSSLPPEYAEELRGIAAGSGESYDAVLSLAMTPELLFDVNCSSFVTRDLGRLVHARNFDFYYPGNVVSKYPLVVRYEIEGRIPFVSAGFVGLFGCYTGSNDRGLSATEDTAIFTRKDKAVHAPVGYALRMVLESCSSLAEARKALASASTQGYLVTVSSLSEKDASVFELVAGRLVENRMEGDRIRVANRCLSEVNRLDNSLLLADFDVNTAREAALDRALSAPAADPIARARAALADRSFADLAELGPLQSLLQDAVRTVNNYTSIESCVIDPAARELHVSWRDGYAASGEFAKICLGDLSASPSFPAEAFLESEDYLAARDFIGPMHRELMAKGFSFNKADYRRLYPAVLASSAPELVKEDWKLAFELRLGLWAAAESSASTLSALLPGSYYGPFWLGFALLKEGRAAEARQALEAAASCGGLSPCADFVVSFYRAQAESALGDDLAASAFRSRAASILGSYRYSQGLADKLGQYFPDPQLPRAVSELLTAKN